LANSLYDDYRERGVEIIHVIIEDSPDEGTAVDWTDAQYWAESMDFDGDTVVDPLNITVLADTDRGLWNRFVQSCDHLSGIDQLYCEFSCHVTPQDQIIDRGNLTVDDTCSLPPGGNQCTACGYSDSHVRSALDSILPAVWCGEATP
jgi:hypothetical protein